MLAIPPIKSVTCVKPMSTLEVLVTVLDPSFSHPRFRTWRSFLRSLSPSLDGKPKHNVFSPRTPILTSKMSQWPVAPEPPTELGRYRVLSSTAGIRVSPLQLGAMSIGEAWSSFMGSMDKEASFKLLDTYFEAGGNFIDAANNYQNEQSDTLIGEWMAARKNGDQIVLATKFTTDYKY